MKKGIYIQEGKVIDFKNSTGSDIEYCQVVALTGCIGIAEEMITNGAVGSLSVAGVYDLPAINTEAFTVGQSLYWDATNEVVTSTSASMIPCGIATIAKSSSATTARVKIG